MANKNESNDTAIVEDGTTGYLAPIGDRATFLDYTERLVKVSVFRVRVRVTLTQTCPVPCGLHQGTNWVQGSARVGGFEVTG